MKGIKFRAWDKELHKMFYSNAEQLDNGLAFLINGHFDNEEPAWMQYTGLKDIEIDFISAFRSEVYEYNK